MKALSIVLSIFALLVIGMVIGYLLWGPTWQVPQQLTQLANDKYDLLRDTLTIVLAFTAITIAVVGAAVYGVVSQKIETETGQRIANESKSWIVWLASTTGYSFSQMGNLEEAIRLTEEAYEYAKELNSGERKNQLLLGEIRNNLASYYARTGIKEELALGYANYIHKNSHKFPEQYESWEKTYKEVSDTFRVQKK